MPWQRHVADIAYELDEDTGRLAYREVRLTVPRQSGKTTLMRRLLRDPAMGRTAVIINEFGEIGIDHDLIDSSDENFIELTTGCLCCKVRSDLVMTLRDMARRRAAGELPPFERVLIETSGLADPAAVAAALPPVASTRAAPPVESSSSMRSTWSM